MLGESEPSAPSRPYVVSGYSGRVYERPVAGPYITFTDAVNETTIMLKWMVSGLAQTAVGRWAERRLGRELATAALAGRNHLSPLPHPEFRPFKCSSTCVPESRARDAYPPSRFPGGDLSL